MSEIVRSPLREQVHRVVLQRIMTEELPPGSRISDTTVAAELGVSRTPVREALLRLEREGLLEVDSGRGFFVRPLCPRDVEEVYPVIWTLEALALREQPAPSGSRLAALERINGELRRVGDAPDRRTVLDESWHATLVEGCPNAVLRETLMAEKAQIRRYEYAYMHDARVVPASAGDHEGIAAAWAAGSVDAAAALLEAHWRRGVEDLVPWLERRAGGARRACDEAPARDRGDGGGARAPLREEIFGRLVRRLVRGDFAGGRRLSDTALAAEMGVSRTPVREALLRLEREGFLQTDVGRGFFVRPLDPGQLRDTAPVVWALEGLALRLCHPLPARTLAELDGINGEAAGAADPAAAVQLQLRWHAALVDGCENRHLRDLLHGFSRMLRRYAHAYWRDTGRVQVSVATHAAVAGALRRRDVDGAVAQLEAAWRAGSEAMAGWLAGGEPAG